MILRHEEVSDIEVQKPHSSGLVDQILEPSRNSDGSLNLYKPKESPPSSIDRESLPSVQSLKKETKDIVFIEKGFPSVIRLDGNRIEDFVSFFV